MPNGIYDSDTDQDVNNHTANNIKNLLKDVVHHDQHIDDNTPLEKNEKTASTQKKVRFNLNNLDSTTSNSSHTDTNPNEVADNPTHATYIQLYNSIVNDLVNQQSTLEKKLLQIQNLRNQAWIEQEAYSFFDYQPLSESGITYLPFFTLHPFCSLNFDSIDSIMVTEATTTTTTTTITPPMTKKNNLIGFERFLHRGRILRKISRLDESIQEILNDLKDLRLIKNRVHEQISLAVLANGVGKPDVATVILELMNKLESRGETTTDVIEKVDDKVVGRETKRDNNCNNIDIDNANYTNRFNARQYQQQNYYQRRRPPPRPPQQQQQEQEPRLTAVMTKSWFTHPITYGHLLQFLGSLAMCAVANRQSFIIV